MNIADDDQNPRPGKKLSKSLDAIAALRIAMEQRMAEARKAAAPQEPSGAEIPALPPEPMATPQPDPEPQPEPATTFIPEEPVAAADEEPAVTEESAAPQQDAASSPQSEKPEESARATERNEQAFSFHDPGDCSLILFRIADRSQKLIDGYLRQQKSAAPSLPAFDPAHILQALMDLTSRILSNPERFTEAQIALWQGYIRIWQQGLARMGGQAATPIVAPAPTDKRFKDKDWQNVWLFDFIKQSYLLTSQWVHGLVKREAEKLDPKSAQKLDFYVDQFLDAVAPSNFWMTNPEVLRATFESGGENLVKGLENLLDDMERGQGQLRISMSSAQSFKVGRDLATTPGHVIFRNRLIELIQYAPTTDKVSRTPLLLMPPWINKYYILDMREKNSLIRYLVDQGHTVFCVSWVNPDERHADIRFDDYMNDGAFAAMREIKNITGEDTINAVGYCIGGTLLASSLAWLNATKNPPMGLPNVASATYFVTMVDFAEPGALGVFIDEDQVKLIEERMQRQGFLDAASMAATFNLLRSNDLIWSFVINNYLLGKEPFPFDILYWNSDSTNLPAAMHSFYLRKMYLENKLAEPNGLEMNGAPIDLTTITTPSFILATREDHIAPWKSTYAATQLYKGPLKFVLASSGHIAGVVNPPAANKYGYWTNDICPPDPEAWLAASKSHSGSWWPEWMAWLKAHENGKVPARTIENGIDAAPGSYVLVKSA